MNMMYYILHINTSIISSSKNSVSFQTNGSFLCLPTCSLSHVPSCTIYKRVPLIKSFMCIYISVCLCICRSMYRYVSVYGNPLQFACLENSMDRGASSLQSTRSQKVGHNWARTLFIHNIDIWASLCMHMELCVIRNIHVFVYKTIRHIRVLYIHMCNYVRICVWWMDIRLSASTYLNNVFWTSLMAQGLRNHLSMQGTRVQSLIWEDQLSQIN